MKPAWVKVAQSEARVNRVWKRLNGRFATGVDAAYLRSKADEIKTSGSRKVLADFSAVPYIDSTGVSFLVGIYVSVVKDSGGRFVLASVNRRVREVLDLTRISTVIPIFNDRDSALAALRASAAQRQ